MTLAIIWWRVPILLAIYAVMGWALWHWRKPLCKTLRRPLVRLVASVLSVALYASGFIDGSAQWWWIFAFIYWTGFGIWAAYDLRKQRNARRTTE